MSQKFRLVIVESPYAPSFPKPQGHCSGCYEPPHFIECDFCEEDRKWHGELLKNLHYVRKAMKDCIARGEAPYASHALYTQPGVLDDTIPEERKRGMEAGFAYRDVVDASVVYTDLGISKGMQAGIDDAIAKGRPVEYRTLGPDWNK